MTFYSAWAFIGLITVPLIIILYLLKQKHEEHIVPSLQLWDEVLLDMKANAPWQRLRRNILMLLQILAAILLTLGLSRPFINVSGLSESVIIVIDTSLSMQAVDVKPSRLEYAKEQAISYVDNLSPDTMITLINISNDAVVEESPIKDKNRIREKIKELNATNFHSNTEAAVNLIQSVLRQYPESEVALFSDHVLNMPDANVRFYNSMGNGGNYAVVLMSHTRAGGNITVLSKIANFSSQDSDIPVSLYVDGQVFDAKKVMVRSGETIDIYWSDIPQKAVILECSIDEKDSLAIDNRAFNVAKRSKNKRVALVSKGNSFIDKLLTLMDNTEVFKIQTQDMHNLKGYDLYIYDGSLPDKLPGDGSIMVFNPPVNEFFSVVDTIEYPKIEQSEHMIFDYISDYSFSIGRSKILETPYWAEEVLKTDKGSLVFAGTRENTRILVFGFDVHNTDLPLKSAFPILITNSVEWLVPSAISNNLNFYSGDSIDFNLNPGVQKATVITPDNRDITIAPPFPAEIFDEINAAGIYTLVQVLPDGELKDYFSVNVPSGQESNLNKLTEDYEQMDNQMHENYKTNTEGGFNLQWIILWTLLCVIVIEWWVYTNGI